MYSQLQLTRYTSIALPSVVGAQHAAPHFSTHLKIFRDLGPHPAKNFAPFNFRSKKETKEISSAFLTSASK